VRNVFVDHRGPGRESIIAAAEGKIELLADGSRELTLLHGRRYEIAPGEADLRVVEFGRYSIPLDEPVRTPLTPSSARALPTLDLLIEPSAAHRGELLWRIGIPVIGLLLSLIAVPLAFINPRLGRSANLIVALLVFVLYLDGIQIMQAWVQQGRMDFSMAAWLPHAIAFAFGALLYVRRVFLLRWFPRWIWPAHWMPAR
jgi:lipopolysaccharide export system permease protein